MDQELKAERRADLRHEKSVTVKIAHEHVPRLASRPKNGTSDTRLARS
jgi:hypothetical protein